MNDVEANDGMSVWRQTGRGLLAAFAACVATCAFSATNYVVPWYANPTATNVAYSASLVTSLDEGAAPLSTAWATASASTNIAETVVAKRMSHTTYFRPRVYALLETGDVVAWTLTNDCTSVKWTTVLTAAELAAAAGVSAGSIATDLQVTDDGRLAFLNYGGTYKALANTPPRWELRIVDGNGDLVADQDVAAQILNSAPSESGCAYITDGKHKLYCYRKDWVRLNVGQKGSTAEGNAYMNDCPSEVLDFSYGCATLANAAVYHDSRTFTSGQKYDIYGYAQGYLGGTATAREPRIFIESSMLGFAYYSRGSWKGIEEVVLDHNLAWKDYFTGYAECVQRLVVNVPNCTTMNSGKIAANQALGETSFEEINFSGLTNLTSQGIKETKARGKLDLPSIRSVRPTSTATWATPLGYNYNLTELSLAAEKKTVEEIGINAFYYDSALKRITIGGVSGFSMDCTNAFYGTAALEDVIFTGGAPTFGGVEYVFDDRAEKQLVFAIPRDSVEWLEFLGEGTVTPLTPEEAAAFKAANPGRPKAYGVVAASVFRTHYNQYIAYVDRTDTYSLTIDRNTFFDDSVTVTSDTAPDASGKYLYGTTITLTAVPSGEGAAFKKWYGDVAKTNQTSASFSFTITEDTWIYARFVHPWTVSADKTTATDGNFVINCRVKSESGHTLKVGASRECGLIKLNLVDNQDGSITTNVIGSGILDLGGPVYIDGDETQTLWKFAELTSNKGSMTVPKAIADGVVTTFISPGTLTTGGGQLFHCGDGDGYARSYKMIVVDEPDVSSFISAWQFANQLNVECLILDLPMQKTWSSEKLWVGMSAAKTKFSWWDLSSLSSMTNTGFYWKWASGGCDYRAERFGASGELALPSMRGLTYDESVGTQLKLMQNVEAISLGGKDKATTVTNLCYNAFAGDSSLRKLTLHADANMQVGEAIFGDSAIGYSAALAVKGRVPDEIHFTGEAISQEAIDNLLADVVAAEKKPVKIYASRYQRGWGGTAPVSWIDRNAANLTTSDRWAANGEKIIGVYRGGAGAPLGKALVIHRDNDWDTKPGIYILVR